MKPLFFFVILFFLFLVTIPSVRAATVLRTADDILRVIENNFDIHLIKENTRKAQAILNVKLGSFYYPQITADASYQNNQMQPFTPFQPAQQKDAFWQVYLESKIPVGMKFTAGKSMMKSSFGQSDPPNALLPYPATFYQPQAYLRVNVNLTQDFLGYITQKEIGIAKADVRVSEYQEKLLRHKLGMTVLEMFYQIPIMIRIKNLSAAVIGDFIELEKSLTAKVDRSLAETSDLYSIRKLIAQQRAVVIDSEKAISEVKSALATLLGDSTLVIEPQNSDVVVAKELSACENLILNTPFDVSLSQESNLLNDLKNKADMEAKVYKRKVLPEVVLDGGVATTGTDASYSAGLRELGDFDRPVYDVGLNFVWQPSPKNLKAAKQASLASKNAISLQNQKRVNEQKSLWENSRQNISLLRKKQNAYNLALSAASDQVKELREQYYKGRLGLFELTQQQISLWQTSMSAVSVKQERMSNVLRSLQYFNQFQCDLLN